MEMIGQIMIYVIMACALLGALASLFYQESELGKQFIKGIETLGTIFIPIAGIMALSPLLNQFITSIIAPLYEWMGADPSLASTTFIAVDMGGYQLAQTLAQTKEAWMIAMTTGYMAGATIVFTIPIALKILKTEDHQYLAYGVMAGFLSIPIGVLVSSVMMVIFQPSIRETISTSGMGTYQLHMTMLIILKNLLPLLLICVSIALGLYYKPQLMIKGFQLFGKVLNALLRIIFVLCVIEHFTHFGTIFMNALGLDWVLDPIVADNHQVNRALESAGYISMMLCGAFPMVFLLQKYFQKPLHYIHQKFHISIQLLTGFIACSANVLAMLGMIKDMLPEDKVKSLAYCVCCAFLLGDHLAFTANFQPTLILPIMIGKLSAGIIAIMIANYFIIPLIRKCESVS